MIHDVDATIREVIRRDAVNGDVEVAFDAPTREWAAGRTTPTINVYLFDIREDVHRRRTDPVRVTDDDGVVIGRRRPPRRYRLSYLVTAWTQRPEDEHRLLSDVLATFLPHEELPRDARAGSLAEMSEPIHATIGLPPPAERSIGEIWNAMGGELKPSLELVVSVPFVLEELRFAGPPVIEQPRFELSDDEGRRTSTDGSDGRPGAASTPGESLADAPVVTEEVVTGGSEDGRGRIVKVRRIDRTPGP